MSKAVKDLPNDTSPALTDVTLLEDLANNVTKNVTLQQIATLISTFTSNKLGSANFSTYTTASTSPVQITGASVTITVPTGSTRNVKITAFVKSMYNGLTGAYSTLSVWNGTVGSGTLLNSTDMRAASTNQEVPATVVWVGTLTGTVTINVGLQTNSTSGTAGISDSGSSSNLIVAELL